MCLFIETINIIEGKPQHPEYHAQRFRQTYRYFFGKHPKAELFEAIRKQYPPSLHGQVKCTVTYDSVIRNITFSPYRKKNINSLQLVRADNLDYSFKYANRDALNNLLNHKGSCDEILIVKNNMVTDTSFSNIIFYDGKRWITPARPLHKGTKRAFLLNEKLILEKDIMVHDLGFFQYASLINAMLDPGESRIHIQDIHHL